MRSINIYEAVVGVGAIKKDVIVEAASLAEAIQMALLATNTEYGDEHSYNPSDVRSIKFKCKAWSM